jgi:hypothetical protein
MLTAGCSSALGFARELAVRRDFPPAQQCFHTAYLPAVLTLFPASLHRLDPVVTFLSSPAWKHRALIVLYRRARLRSSREWWDGGLEAVPLVPMICLGGREQNRVSAGRELGR